MHLPHRIRKLWECLDCGETRREKLIRGPGCSKKKKRKALSSEQIKRWLETRKTEACLTIKNCGKCSEAFYCYIIDNYRTRCYKEECKL